MNEPCWNCDADFDADVWKHCQSCGARRLRDVEAVCRGIASMAVRVESRRRVARNAGDESVWKARTPYGSRLHPTRHGAALAAFDLAWKAGQRVAEYEARPEVDLTEPGLFSRRRVTGLMDQALFRREYQLSFEEACQQHAAAASNRELEEMMAEANRALATYGHDARVAMAWPPPDFSSLERSSFHHGFAKDALRIAQVEKAKRSGYGVRTSPTPSHRQSFEIPRQRKMPFRVACREWAKGLTAMDLERHIDQARGVDDEFTANGVVGRTPDAVELLCEEKLRRMEAGTWPRWLCGWSLAGA